MPSSSPANWECTLQFRISCCLRTLILRGLGYLCDLVGARPISLLASLLFAASYTLASQSYSHQLPLWTFLVSFFFIGMGTSALYFSALTTTARNFSNHRGLSIAIPVAAFGLSSFWESLIAGSALFSKEVQVNAGGDVVRELDVVKLFHFFAVLLGVSGVIGTFALIVIPAHLPKHLSSESEEDASEEDALIPRAQEDSETSSVISMVSARSEVIAEHRPFIHEPTTYYFGIVLLILLGSGEMFINCVCPPVPEALVWG